MANVRRQGFFLLMNDVAAFVLRNFLVVEIIVSVNESLVVHELAQASRIAGDGDALDKWLLLTRSFRFEAYAIASNSRVYDTYEDVSSSASTCWTGRSCLSLSACLRKLHSAIAALCAIRVGGYDCDT